MNGAFLSDWPSMDVSQCDAIQFVEDGMLYIQAGEMPAQMAKDWRRGISEHWVRGLTTVTMRYMGLYGKGVMR